MRAVMSLALLFGVLVLASWFGFSGGDGGTPHGSSDAKAFAASSDALHVPADTVVAPIWFEMGFDEMLEEQITREQPVDLGIASLAAAEGLPGSVSVDRRVHAQQIDEMARRVASETRTYLHRFCRDPAEFRNSEAYFRMLMLVTVLQQDFGVRYNPERMLAPDFRDAADLFLHGILSGQGGTCASMPVLYTAVARRLGYPVYLVTTRGHIFVRWKTEDEQFNIEGTNQGLSVFPDEHYLEWPFELTRAEAFAEGHLRELSPAAELALLAVLRAHVLEESTSLEEGIELYAKACELDPDAIAYQGFYRAALAQEPQPSKNTVPPSRSSRSSLDTHAFTSTAASNASRLNLPTRVLNRIHSRVSTQSVRTAASAPGH